MTDDLRKLAEEIVASERLPVEIIKLAAGYVAQTYRLAELERFVSEARDLLVNCEAAFNDEESHAWWDRRHAWLLAAAEKL